MTWFLGDFPAGIICLREFLRWVFFHAGTEVTGSLSHDISVKTFSWHSLVLQVWLYPVEKLPVERTKQMVYEIDDSICSSVTDVVAELEALVRYIEYTRGIYTHAMPTTLVFPHKKKDQNVLLAIPTQPTQVLTITLSRFLISQQKSFYMS